MTRSFQIIAAVPAYKSEIRVDGNLLDGVRGFRLTGDVGSLTQLELDVLLLEDTPLSGEAVVTVPESTRETLVALGWTPPAEGGDRS